MKPRKKQALVLFILLVCCLCVSVSGCSDGTDNAGIATVSGSGK